MRFQFFWAARQSPRLANVHTKLRGRWPRGDANSGRVVAATNAPRPERDATNLTPSEYCSAKGGSAARPNTGRDSFSV
jgi:hypothetical protein